MTKVLIVAKCNVNSSIQTIDFKDISVLIVAKCNVNGEILGVDETYFAVLIVAKCNVNPINASFNPPIAKY